MLHRSLAIKLIIYIGIILILILGIFAFININVQKKYLIEELQQNGIQLIQTIKKSIKYEMLTARSDHIQKTLEDVGKQEGLEQIRIFDKEGKIVAANSLEEIGLFIDRQAEACYVCHKETEPSKELTARGKTRIFRSDKGYRVLGIINPIYN